MCMPSPPTGATQPVVETTEAICDRMLERSGPRQEQRRQTGVTGYADFISDALGTHPLSDQHAEPE